MIQHVIWSDREDGERTVVLSTGSNAFLRVDGLFEFREGRSGVDGAEEDGLVLIHSGSVARDAVSWRSVERDLTRRKGRGGNGGERAYPALAKRRVGSSYGMVELDLTKSWPSCLK